MKDANFPATAQCDIRSRGGERNRASAADIALFMEGIIIVNVHLLCVVIEEGHALNEIHS